jgi:hypothetical protein
VHPKDYGRTGITQSNELDGRPVVYFFPLGFSFRKLSAIHSSCRYVHVLR